MFNSISGIITAKLPATLRIETNGLEWDLMVPALSLDVFGPVGSRAKVYTWLYHREDQMRLFGFASAPERDLFFDLMKVDGIGPKQAIKILSSIPVPELEKALEDADLSRLESAPGIGKKTAQKMILALKGKLTSADTGTPNGKGARNIPHEDIVNALADMGFDRRLVIETVESLSRNLAAEGGPGGNPEPGSSQEQEIFRQAIIALSR